MLPECRNLWAANRLWPLSMNCLWANKLWCSDLVWICFARHDEQKTTQRMFPGFSSKHKEQTGKRGEFASRATFGHMWAQRSHKSRVWCYYTPTPPLRLLVFTRLQPPRLLADGWKRAEKLKGGGGGGGVGGASSTFSFPSWVQTRAVFSAAICWPAEEDAICLRNSAGNTGGKHRVRLNIKSIQRAAAETFKPSAAGAHSCRAKEPLWQNTAAGGGGLEDE